MGERGGVALLELVEGVVHGRGDGIPQNADTGSFERGQERKKNPVKAAEPSGTATRHVVLVKNGWKSHDRVKPEAPEITGAPKEGNKEKEEGNRLEKSHDRRSPLITLCTKEKKGENETNIMHEEKPIPRLQEKLPMWLIVIEQNHG
jgi:hypothetical protein